MAWMTRKQVRSQPVQSYSEKQLQKLLGVYDKAMGRLNDQYLRMMGEHIRDIGTMWPSDVHRLQQIRRMNKNLRQLQHRIGVAAGRTEAQIGHIFEEIAKEDVRMQQKILGVPDILRIEHNKPLQRILQAQARETAGRMRNLSNTTVVSKYYRDVVDEAVTAVQSGVEDYNTAIRRVIREAGEHGLRITEEGTKKVDYESGFSRRLDTAARMNVLDGVRHLNQSIMEEVSRQFGANGVEIDAHMLCAEDHLPYQGGQYSNEEFEDIQDSLDRPFGEWNCRHSWHGIILGVSPPTYTPDQLDQMQRYSTEMITIDDRTKTRYQWSQEMRKVETAVRQQKDTANLAHATGDDKLRLRCQGTILQLNQKYEALANKAGLQPEFQRTYMAGFKDAKIAATMSRPKADIGSWPEAGTKITAAELRELQKYASDRRVDLRSFDNYDGDVSLIKDFIDGIVTVSKDYPEVLEGKRPLQLRCSYRIDPETYAKITNRCISINGNAFRNREALEADYRTQANGNFFVRGTTYRSIAYHEMGHILVDTFGLSPKQIVGKLKYADVSIYAGDSVDEAVAESVSAHYAGVDNKTALTIYSRCATMIAERRRR